jgi:hypothetical protein
MPVDVFYENVSKAKFEGTLSETHERDENIVLEFRPSNGQLMLVACGRVGRHVASQTCSHLRP